MYAQHDKVLRYIEVLNTVLTLIRFKTLNKQII